VGTFVGEDAVNQRHHLGIVDGLLVLLVLSDGGLLGPHVSGHPLVLPVASQFHLRSVQGRLTPQLGYGLSQPAEVAHLIARVSLDLRRHLPFTDHVSML